MEPSADTQTFLRQQRLRKLTSSEIGYWTYRSELLPPEGPYNTNVRKGQNSIDLIKKLRAKKWQNNGVISSPTGISIHSTSYIDPKTVSGRRHSVRPTSGRTNKVSLLSASTSTRGKTNITSGKDYLGAQIPRMKKLRKTSNPDLPQTTLHPFIASQGEKVPDQWEIVPQTATIKDRESSEWIPKPQAASSNLDGWQPQPLFRRRSSKAINQSQHLFCSTPNVGLIDSQRSDFNSRTSRSSRSSTFSSRQRQVKIYNNNSINNNKYNHHPLQEKFEIPAVTQTVPPAQPHALNLMSGEEKLQYEPQLGTIGLIQITKYPQTEAKCQSTLEEYKATGNNILKDIDINEDDAIFDNNTEKYTQSLNDSSSSSSLDLLPTTSEPESELEHETHRSTLKSYQNYKMNKSEKKAKLQELKVNSLSRLGKCLKIPKTYGEYDEIQDQSTFKSARYDRLLTEEGKPGTYGYDNDPRGWVHTIADTANGDLRAKGWSHNLRGMRW